MRVPISPGAVSVSTLALAASVCAAAVALLSSPVAAQTGGISQPTVSVAVQETVAAPLSNTQPDVQIVVLALPTGTYAVSSVYPKQIPKAVAQGRIDRLLALTKWTATNRKFSDAPATPNPLSDSRTPKGKLSAASFETTGMVYAADGTINWEPFLRAFGDVRRINMVCFTATDFAYRGPVSFESDRVSFSASAGEGTVAAVANLKKPEPSPAVFGLPQYRQDDTPAKKTPNRSKKNDGNRAVYIVFIALAATGVGLILYALASRLVTKP